jgi:hypothetical protein
VKEQIDTSTNPKEVPTSTSDLDDFADLRMSQEFADELGVEKLLSEVSVGKPNKQVFFQIHPDPEFRLETAALRLKTKNETYLVARPLWASLAPEITRVMLFTGISRQGRVFIWDIPLPGPDGKHHEAHQVQLNTAMLAMGTWMRLTWNDDTRGYDVIKASAELSAPKWPNKTLEEILKVAFKGRFIKSNDHPVLKELRGET